MLTEPKLKLPGATVNPACTPVPLTAAVAFTPSSLETVKLPDAAPLAAGEYFTVSVTLCEGAIVAGRVTPLTEIPAPLAATFVTVTLELPVLESTTFCEALLPAFTLPKLTFAGARDIV